ncbi:MAG: M6 family metalloprotease domain-containing protein [Muribaculaceae bacterium]|nr:M6 family metalloprotease domain-containing protein [Muribaculaceae bacterium]
MKRILTFIVAVILLGSAAWAVPAKPGLITITQSDGTKLQIQMFGDEFNRSLATADGLTIQIGEDGFYYYRSAQGLTDMRAHNAEDRNPAELEFLSNHNGEFTLAALSKVDKYVGTSSGHRALMPQRATQVPTSGSPRIPIILVQYADKKMSNTLEQIEAHYKTEEKSAFQYFVDQSNGQYTPQFDLYGIYDLPNDRIFYGDNSGDLDVGVAQMVIDAIDLAGDEIDWSLYDNDGDNVADVCVVVYAGVGEAQAWSTVPASVWPCQWDLTEAQQYGDGTGPQERNGIIIDKFAVFNEISGRYDNGTILDGIGTFCHEFSHCLGLPDFYSTINTNYYGMGIWSLMDDACYNGGEVSGDTPIGYSAYEKNFMGWIDLITPEDNTQYTLPVFNSKNIDDDQALKITAFNENEYWILENRRQQGWDEFIPDEGILITHFTYVKNRWDANSVNNYNLQLATVIPADGALNVRSEDTDLYGETNHDFTGDSSPAMKANMNADGSLASTTGGAGTITDKRVANIYLNDDGTATLWYNRIVYGDVNGDGMVDVEDVNILINIILHLDNASNYGRRAFITDDDIVDVEDVNAIINIILKTED